jgi:ribonuclease R
MERRAEEAERDTIKLKKTEYMEQFEGEMFTGVISGVTAFGFYVELPNTVEGMVHVNTLTDDYYIYDEKNYQLMGETTGRTFYLGQEVTVQVTGTNRMLKQVDFGLVGQREHRRKKTGRKEGGRGKRK